MTLETRNRLLTVVFLIIITILVGEISYLAFSKQLPFTPQASPTPSPQIITSPPPLLHSLETDQVKNKKIDLEKAIYILNTIKKIQDETDTIESLEITNISKGIITEINKKTNNAYQIFYRKDKNHQSAYRTINPQKINNLSISRTTPTGTYPIKINDIQPNDKIIIVTETTFNPFQQSVRIIVAPPQDNLK